MSEKEWVMNIRLTLEKELQNHDPKLRVFCGKKLAYAHEIRHYSDSDSPDAKSTKYETDLLISEHESDGSWKPRVVVECKLGRINTHDAITYSQKAASHKHVHPYLRYGFLLGHWGSSPLPGRLYRHGAFFDFMMSWWGKNPSRGELMQCVGILKDEVAAARTLEQIIYENRKRDRNRFAWLHRPLKLG